MTIKQIRKLAELENALRNAFNTGDLKGFKKCSQSDLDILWYWVQYLKANKVVYSIRFSEPIAVMKRYGLDNLVID